MGTLNNFTLAELADYHRLVADEYTDVNNIKNFLEGYIKRSTKLFEDFEPATDYYDAYKRLALIAGAKPVSSDTLSQELWAAKDVANILLGLEPGPAAPAEPALLRINNNLLKNRVKPVNANPISWVLWAYCEDYPKRDHLEDVIGAHYRRLNGNTLTFKRIGHTWEFGLNGSIASYVPRNKDGGRGFKAIAYLCGCSLGLHGKVSIYDLAAQLWPHYSGEEIDGVPITTGTAIGSTRKLYGNDKSTKELKKVNDAVLKRAEEDLKDRLEEAKEQDLIEDEQDIQLRLQQLHLMKSIADDRRDKNPEYRKLSDNIRKSIKRTLNTMREHGQPEVANYFECCITIGNTCKFEKRTPGPKLIMDSLPVTPIPLITRSISRDTPEGDDYE